MENFEFNLSLGIISRHVDKSHNQLSQHLSKQVWNQQDRQCILDCLAQLLLEKDYTLLIARHLRPLILDLLERNSERVKAGGKINHDLHERLCVALSKLLSISPDALGFAAKYFNSAPPVFQRLFFTNEESSAVKYGPRRMKLRDLMGATLHFLQSDCAKFRMLWDWSPCVSQLLTSDIVVRWYTAHCLALVSHMTDNQKMIFLRKVLTSDEILHMKIKDLEEAQQLEVEKALVLANQGTVMWRQEQINKFTRGQVVSGDLSQNVVAVCGVVLPRIVPKPTEQMNQKDLVLVNSTCSNLRRLAMAVASQKPVLLEGPIGCGKTALVEFMAAVTGHSNATEILKVQLGDQTDSKILLGMYRCTDIPGKFVWQPGTLTKAVSEGRWILLEDIDHAPLDVISVLLPLMENKKLMIPGRDDCIDVVPGFQFFATRRLYFSGGSWHKPQNSHAVMLDKYWTKLQMGNMTREELKKVLISKYPRLMVVADRLMDIYCQLTGEMHSDPDSSSLQTTDESQQNRAAPLEGRLLSQRDLLKWCDRINVNFDNSSSATAQHVFQEALDCFTSMLSCPESRLRMAEIIGSKLNISKEKAQHFCQMYQPGISLTEPEVSVGRVSLGRKQMQVVQLSVDNQTFAATRPSCVLLEQLAVCVTKGEPVLLVGETGTGKTSTVQHLARVTGHRLRVVNMNQQSDTADLLGGYKPVDHKQILLPLREAFEELFSQTYSRKQNLTFLGHVQTCFRKKRWHDLLKLMDHVCKSALTKELQEQSNAALLREKWEALALKVSQTQQQIHACEHTMVFSFVEGTLAQAVKKGHWILLDEINLATAETLECLSGLLEGTTSSVVLLDRGDTEPLVRHPDFQLFACMNPATDVGKRNLPLGLRNRFTELYVDELENEEDLQVLVLDYLKCLNPHRSVVSGIISFYLAVRKEANSHLVDGTGHKPHYSLRTLCRALKYVSGNPCNSVQRSLYEGFCLSFLTQLDRSSYPLVQKLVCQHILMGNKKCLKQPIPAPSGQLCVEVEGYWLCQGDMEPTLDPSYILTPSVKLNLHDLARVVSAGTHPVLIQGETSVGKTSLIHWLAAATGNQCVRINNHEHTDIQEYIGCYSSDDRGKLVFKEGVLIDAMRKGYWIILDELNLAPTDVLEALNRLLDDNRELFVTETQEVIKAHPRFMLFATQNPPGLYGGRKVLSRAFRNRFVELHFNELPVEELETILHQRCSLPPSYCTKLVRVMQDLQSLRRGSSVFAGKHGFITLRDLFRWADRYRLEEQTEASQDWLKHLADDGYMLLAGRVRKPEEEATILSILEKHFKRTVKPDDLFSQRRVISQFSPFIDSIAGVPEDFRHVVWTNSMRRLAVLVGRALRYGESVLLVGDTGCGKTTICQLFAALSGQKFFSVNCHLHMETSDFLGGLRPARHTHQPDGEDGRLFQWHDGPLVLAMKEGGVFLMDEISLADDSVLERLNSVLETEKSLVLAEKGSGENDDVELIRAARGFRLVATMNPGGDFGKKELSPALRNRFTEIWCPQSNSRSDLVQIIQHNLRSGLTLDGCDIAELMLDFIEWLTQQDFGRRCILSVRDILSWVNFLNTVCERDEDGFMTMGALEDEEAEWDLRLDTFTAFIHAACLVYIDGIGSGTTVSCVDNALLARGLCLSFLQKRLSKGTKLDQEMLESLRVYDSNLPREPQWGEDFFGIDPFYIALGPQTESRDVSDYTLAAGTTAMNAQRLLRALKLQKPVLLEGSPGVGKTSLVAALAKASGNHLVRINLSEQTDVTDLFGTDLPVEGGKGGEFAWRDGPLLAALKAGHWVVLDELNLASQSVLEGLNACFDHRAEIYIPELGMSFQVQHEKTKIFGCQNPFTQGGGRKGLPKSFLNRFTQVFMDQLSSKDMEFIGNSIFPNIDKKIIGKMVEFSNRLVQEVCVERRWGQKGSPWEFNLRDIFRWCQLMQADQSPGFFSPGQHVALVYGDRMRTEADKAQVLSMFKKVFESYYEPYTGSREFHITPLNLQVGFSVLQRSGGAPVALDPPLSITHQALRPLESLMKCVEMGWMTILVGPMASGKTSLVRLLALLTGHRLRVMAMNSSMDTTELLGGFEQVDIMRPWQQVLESVDYIVAMVIRRGLMSLDVGVQDTEFLMQTWGLFCHWLKKEGLQTTGGMVNSEALNRLEVIILLLQKLNTKLKVFTDMSKLQMDFTLLKERLAQLEDGWTNGGFEWVDSMLVQALQAGDWLLMDNVNFCSAAVLDRLNSLLEPGGSLTINECGVIDGKTPQITPHPNFRLFLTMDPVHGELSRAMRNRGVEVFIPGEHEGVCWDALDLKTLLHTAGVTGDCVCDLLIEIHKSIKSAIWDSPTSSVASLSSLASLLSCQLQRGVDLPSALQHACREAYSLCQRTTASQKQAQHVIEQHLAILDTEDWGSGLLCAGVWPDSFPSALLSTEDSCFSTVLKDGQVLSFCLNTLSLQGKRNRPLSLNDLHRVLQSSSVHEDLVFSGGVVDLEGGDVLRLIPTAVRLVTERASHGDWILRSTWLSHLGKSYKYAPDSALVQVEAGNRALKAVFGSKLATKGKSLAELLQPHSTDEYRILMDMRWNKQYLDILANKCNFEDEERYMEFLEALNAVANRIALMMDREERAVICTCAVNLSAQNCALRIATAFSKGTVDVGQLPHPVLMHLHSFFELWNSFTLQAVQSGQPYISDHIMFEILQLLQWLDRFWDVCSTLPADSQCMSILSLHWQWVQKHLILRLPQLLLGDADATFEGHQELEAVSAAIHTLLSTPVSVATALKGIQKTLGKPLPFKLESVAECVSRLRVLSKALDVSSLKLDSTTFPWKQELLQLYGAGLRLDMKESLLEALGLVLLANNQLDPQKSGVLERLVSSVEQQQRQMTSIGLLEVSYMSEGQETADRGRLACEELQQLSRKAQLWPLMEQLAVLNQLRLSTDLLNLTLSPGDQESEDRLRRELSRHLRYCLQSTPMNVRQLQPLWFLLSSDRPAEEMQFVWCELLSEALDALWTSSVTSNPDHWLKWDPLNPKTQPDSKLPLGADKMGPALLSKAVWSHCMLRVLTKSETGDHPEPSGDNFFSLSHVMIGQWKKSIQQLQDVSAVLWENMAIPALSEFRGTDFRLQGIVLRRQLQSMVDLLPPTLQEGYMENCESLVEDPDPLVAAQEIQKLFRDFLPPKLLPDSLVEACITCLQQYIQSKIKGSNTLARSGVFWVNMGLLQIKVWTPQTIFDPAVKRAYKLNYAKQELALLQEEWRGRSLSSQLMTGAELEESSTTDGFQHPRIRYLWIRIQQVKEQIAELSRKQAYRPCEPQYGRLFQELQHYLCSIGQASAVQDLLSQLLKALQGSSSQSRSAVQGLLKEESVWQTSQQRFCQRLQEDYLLYPDLVGPVRNGILQLQYGMRLVAAQVAASLTPVPGLPKLVSCLLAFPTMSRSLPSDLSRADFLCSRECMDVLHSLARLLPQQDSDHVVPESSTILFNALLHVQCHILSTGELSQQACALLRHICQALVNEWDEKERQRREQEQLKSSLYSSQIRIHGSQLTEDEQEERDFRRQFPQFSQEFADIVSAPSLEGPPSSGLEEEKEKALGELTDTGFLSPAAMNTLVELHQCLCLGYAQSLWYQGKAPVYHKKQAVKVLVSSYQIAAPVMSRFYHLMDAELDQQLLGSELLLSSLLQNSIQGSGGPYGLAVTSEGPYDFYQQPNMAEALLCLPVLEQLKAAVKQRLDDWPEHPALLQLTVVMERILSFSLASPLAKFLNGLEIVLSKAQDWENNASRSVSLRKELEAVTQLIIQWRKLELNCWSSSLDNAMKRHTEKSTKHWFSIYQLVEKYLEEQRTETNTGEDVEHLSLSSVSSTLKAFMEGSTLGEFHTRLSMLLSFHCHLLLVPNQPGQESLSSLLWNLHKYYSQFSACIQTKIDQLRQPIEKELKDFVKISKWNDVSFWSIKHSVEKTHRTLFKFVKKFEEALNGPSAPALVEQGCSASHDSVDSNPEQTPIHQVHQALRAALPGKGRDLPNEGLEEGVEASLLQGRLPILTRKMKKLCCQLLKKHPVPELAEDLDCFTGEIIRNIRNLQSFTIDMSAEKEKQKAEVKHILQQKQRALSDLFKMLTEIGLSYRKGLTWNRTDDPLRILCMQPLEMSTAFSNVNQDHAETTLFTQLLTAWGGCQKYFYLSWSRKVALHTALQHPAKELGLGTIERCRGFTSHIFQLLLKQRQRLAKLTEQWVHLRRLTNRIQDVKAQLQSSNKDCTLPPQSSLQAWISKGQTLAVQCTTLLQQLVWLLQCCPENLQEKEDTRSCSQHTFRCPSPLTAQRQPPGCLMRRGDTAWCQLHQCVNALLKQTESLKVELDTAAQQASEESLHTWNHFVTCCSAFDKLGAVVAEMPGIEQLFTPAVCVGSAQSQPAITQSLQYVRGQVEMNITDFTTWRTQLMSLEHQHTDHQSSFCTEFTAELDTSINTVLCAVQTLVKRKEREQQKQHQEDSKTEGAEGKDEEPVEDLLKPGHLTSLLEEQLEAEVEALCVGDVVAGLERLLRFLRTHRDTCQAPQLSEVTWACRIMVRLEPLLGIYSDLVRYYLAVSLGAHRSTGKLLSVLASIFMELAQKGFCLPQELMAGGDGEGATEFHNYEGGGIGEGEGNKDVSEKIENEDQVEDTFQEGQEKEEQQDKGNINAEDNAIEMSEDFDGQMHDGENKPGEDDESDKEDEEELDKKMGNLGEGQTETLDERMWGDDHDDEQEEGSDNEEESGQGMDMGESKLVAKDDNLDAADPNKDNKTQDKEEHMDDKEEEKIHEQADERQFDENEVDPYHGQQDKPHEPEAMDLPEDLNLDENDAADDGEGEGDEENPFKIGEKTMDLEERDDKETDGKEEQGTEEMLEDQTDQPEEEKDQRHKSEEEEGEKAEADEAEKQEEMKEERGLEEGRDEDLTVPSDKGHKPKEEEECGDENEEQRESAERKEHNTDGQTGDENVQSDTAVELAGEASERDQAKEEHGTGAADASQSEGHQSELAARMALNTETECKTQNFKRKPGHTDNERSTGDYSEHVNKRLRTIDNSKDSRQNDAKQESDLYEHIKQGEESYDTQTYDVASADQQKATGAQQEHDEDQIDEDIAMETDEQEDNLRATEIQELKPELMDSTKASQKGVDSGELQRQREEKEKEILESHQDPKEGERADRNTESTIHTVPQLLLATTQNAERDLEEIRKEMELQLELWHKLAPGTHEEESAAVSMWHQYQTLTSALSQQLCEQLRLILEPTQATKLKGDYRTGKRLNMRKVIPYIASQFRKDKIWLRRTKPSKREYHICLAVDDSSSMVDNHSKQLAFESLSVIINALTLLEVGQVSVCSFGEQVQLLHPFGKQFNDESGARILRLCQFQQKKTRIGQFLEAQTKMFLSARQQIPGPISSDTAQLLVIVSDGRGLFLEGKERVTAAVQAACGANVFVIFVVLDNPNSRDSILDIKVPIFKGPGELPDIRSYMEEFPFPFYVILRDVNSLPETLSDALRQWFELVTAVDQ
ncbi:Midasin Dynein-related AAA-ATPase MDN1 MIDAS-containing protein [Channa argus]|uniref:Midasin n=1 Tax=Channa argus TaxID=215402 RepID=A0A6G1QJ60_CHAAH|nr:Midasin Dynein-related AAA-ATPase MDN1 MIDAS-containing protein [Channa argus]